MGLDSVALPACERGFVIVALLTEKKTSITVAYGDRMGRKIMDPTVRIHNAAWAQIAQETFTTDHWCCRYAPKNGGKVDHAAAVALLPRIDERGVDFIKTENLYDFDGKRMR
jgi:hypothetical protein